MRKCYALACIWMVITSLTTMAQPRAAKADKNDMNKALMAGDLLLGSNKTVLSANEAALITVCLQTPLSLADDPVSSVKSLQYWANNAKNDNVPFGYTAKNWKILQGGGTLTQQSDFVYAYKAPAVIPKDNIMVISVEMEPNSAWLPKLMLSETLYFGDGGNIFTVGIPSMGIINEKYRGADGAGATSIFYDEDKDETVVKLSNLQQNMDNGKPISRSSTAGAVKFVFKGPPLVGVHTLSSGNGTFIFGSLNNRKKDCSCGEPGTKKSTACNGVVEITEVNKDFIKGDIGTTVYGSKGRDVYPGTVYGVFTAHREN